MCTWNFISITSSWFSFCCVCCQEQILLAARIVGRMEMPFKGAATVVSDDQCLFMVLVCLQYTFIESYDAKKVIKTVH